MSAYPREWLHWLSEGSPVTLTQQRWPSDDGQQPKAGCLSILPALEENGSPFSVR